MKKTLLTVASVIVLAGCGNPIKDRADTWVETELSKSEVFPGMDCQTARHKRKMRQGYLDDARFARAEQPGSTWYDLYGQVSDWNIENLDRVIIVHRAKLEELDTYILSECSATQELADDAEDWNTLQEAFGD